MKRVEVLGILADLIEIEEEGKQISEETTMDEVIFDSITKLGVLALLDTYAAKKVTVQELLDCQKIKDIIDLIY